MTKFSLSSYLMVSVLFIVSGILWVLFTQVDDNYEYSIFSPDLQREQSDIIQRVYQLKPEISATQQELTSVTPENLQAMRESAPVIQPANTYRNVNQTVNQYERQAAVVAPSVEKNNYNDVWSTFPVLNSEDDFLRNNPWNPQYKPGY